MKILLIDNYDSFTFNLKHLIESCGDVQLTVKRNDEDFIKDVKAGHYDGAVIGPGPGSPVDEAYFGHNKSLILDCGTKGLPILGVCLGFQGIYHHFGGTLKLGEHPVHGKTSALSISSPGVILKNIKNGVTVMRYHSILADLSQPVPDDIDITAYATARDTDGPNISEPMALEHKKFPIYGVQFHPESFATQSGKAMIANFLAVC